MLEHCQNNQERYQRVQKLVQQWLNERNNLQNAYTMLRQVKNPDRHCQHTLSYLKNFCETLIDYISAGHFEVYDQLAKESEAFGENYQAWLATVHRDIQPSTDCALDFHETYNTDEQCIQAFNKLQGELLNLRQALEQRFQLEDQMIEQLHSCHGEAVTA